MNYTEANKEKFGKITYQWCIGKTDHLCYTYQSGERCTRATKNTDIGKKRNFFYFVMK